ncbi:glycosyltransferase family 2 protein [Alphaproteobacteria bacterium]|nr:glycosyltransferase family 2 protein [Alphaproteobacteria bacterium]
MKKINLTVVILTFNEELNIRTSLNSVSDWAKYVYILDSESKDQTCNIALEYGAEIFLRKFDTFANQRNYAISELPLKTEWMLFLDADEYLLDSLKSEINDAIYNKKYDGFYLKRRFYFMGKWIKYGGYYPTWILRLFKHKLASCNRDVNEHVVVNGKIGKLKCDFVDNNKKDVTDWIEKHNKYSTFEAIELIKNHKNSIEIDEMANIFGTQVERKRWVRERVWNRLLPPLIRPWLYFFYRYILRLGFLDGKEGFIYHTLHGLLYRILIDVKFVERKKNKK